MAKKTPNPIDRHVGSRVRMRRVMLGMSQEKLGTHLGVTFQQVQKYEKGMNCIGASRLQNAARALEVSVDFLFEGAPEFGSGEVAQPGFADSAQSNYIADFLSSNEGVELNQAFVRIKDRRLRRRIIDLVRAVAGMSEDESGQE